MQMPVRLLQQGGRCQLVSIELKNLSKSFNSLRVFADVNATIETGCLVVTGRNGSGKSTLLKIIAGLLSPTNGEVIVIRNGRSVPADARKMLFGLAAPDVTLYDELSALENLRFFAQLRGISKTESTLCEDLLELGFESGRENDPFGSLSLGMRQRVKLAYALMHHPAVLLLDEPFSSLDEAGAVVLHSVLSKQRERGIAIIATNDSRDLCYGDQTLTLGE